MGNVSLGDIEIAVNLLINSIGDTTDREGTKDTPSRVARMWNEMYENQKVEITTFGNPAYDQMICKVGIKFFSFCEHHMLPFFGTVDIAYLPNERVIGISKLSRIVKKFASKLNIQEGMTNDIANYIMEKLMPKGVMVVVKAKHLCEIMRGVRNDGTMITSALRGEFKLNSALKQEFLSLKEQV